MMRTTGHNRASWRSGEGAPEALLAHRTLRVEPWHSSDGSRSSRRRQRVWPGWTAPVCSQAKRQLSPGSP